VGPALPAAAITHRCQVDQANGDAGEQKQSRCAMASV